MSALSKMRGFNRLVGVEVERVANGESVLFLDVSEEHLNSAKIVHGGVLATILDSACGAAVFSVLPEDKFAPTTTMSIAYMNAVGGGRLRAHGRVLKKGGKLLHCEADVFCDQLLLAKAQTSFTVLERRVPLNVEPSPVFEG